MTEFQANEIVILLGMLLGASLVGISRVTKILNAIRLEMMTKNQAFVLTKMILHSGTSKVQDESGQQKPTR